MTDIRVQMPLGTGSVSVGGESYTADEDGIVTLKIAEHVAPLVALGGIELGEGDVPGSLSVLVGTGTLPSMVEIGGDQEPLQLGEVVRQTHQRTGISVDQWNNLPQEVRDILIGYQVGSLRGEIGPVRHLQDQIDEQISQLEVARAEIQELTARLDAPEAEPQGPDFAAMTMGQIEQWMKDNNGPKPSGNKDDFVAAAVAHQKTL